MSDHGHSVGPGDIEAVKLVSNAGDEVLTVDTDAANNHRVYFKPFIVNTQALDG